MKLRTAAILLMLAATLGGCVSSNSRFKKAAPEQMAQTNMALAIEYMKIGKLAESRDFIEKALSQDADNANVEMTAGLVYERLRETPKAERAYSRAYSTGKKDPNIVSAYAGFLCRTGKTEQGEKLFVEVASSPVYTTPEVAWVNAGVCARSAGDALDAEKYFTHALAIRPNTPEAMLQMGNLSFDRDDSATALDWVKRFLQSNPATPDVLWLGVRASRKLGDGSGAANYARRIQAEFPNSEPALILRSGVDR